MSNILFGQPGSCAPRHLPTYQRLRQPKGAEVVRGGATVPLKRLKEEYLEQDGVRFLMEDEDG